MAAYNLIATSAAASSSRIGVYIPYTDWWSDRWTNIIVPALDAFRRLGVSPDILPFVPPPGEEILPYYPLHLNPEQLAFFQANNYVLVLADIGGFQDTDALLVKRFIEEGGRVVFFGNRIPYTRAYNRDEANGGRENPAKSHTRVEVRQPLQERARAGTQYRFAALESPSWTAAGGMAAAVFEDGSAAVLMNTFGKGMCFTIPLTLAEAVRVMPDLVRDVLDAALEAGSAETARPFDVAGLDEDSDIAMSTAGERRVVAVVNYKKKPVEIDLHPSGLEPDALYALTDLKTRALIRLRTGKELTRLEFSVPAVDFICLSLAPEK